MIPLLVTGSFYLVVAAVCLARPRIGRVVVGIFFWIMALAVHGYFVLANPRSYVDFAHDAYLGFYSSLASPVVEFSPRGFGLVCLLFELVVGALILSKGRYVKVGLVAGIVFLLGITPLRYTQMNPILAAGMAYLLTQNFTQSLLEPILGGPLHQRRPKAPA